jgi:uncharacterized protein Veg
MSMLWRPNGGLEIAAVRLVEIREALRAHPFEPFRIHLSNGRALDVRHPEMALLTPYSVHVVQLTPSGKPTYRVVKCDLLHVVAMEPVNGKSGKRNGKRS